jgi:hypothetical protein
LGGIAELGGPGSAPVTWLAFAYVAVEPAAEAWQFRQYSPNPILGYDACGHCGEEPFRRAVSSLSTDVFDGDGLDGLRSAQYQPS